MLTKRLEAVADMVTPGQNVADIGTDHGYVPIYLIKENRAKHVYACDIAEGPLLTAYRNIRDGGFEDDIETILSNGTESLEKGSVDCIVIAGMGGDLIVGILNSSTILDDVQELVLSPQKRPDLVRKCIIDLGFYIESESMLEEAGKTYVIIKAKRSDNKEYSLNDVELTYGPVLLEEKDEVLKAFLENEKQKFEDILKDAPDDEHVKEVLDLNKKALAYFE